MRTLCLSVAAALAFLLTLEPAAPAADSKEAEPMGDAKELIVGKWETVKQKGMTVEFKKGDTPDKGEVKVELKFEEKTLSVDGTYEFKDNTLELTLKNPLNPQETKTEKLTIKSISKDTMVMVDGRMKQETFKKVR
jgi:uncharacterized protein (TIGR03066 family)